MTIGERIRRIRTLRGMTQKDLGIALGFPARSADVRVAQYESGSRTPKEDLIAAMARVLNVVPRAIADPFYDNPVGLMYLFFDLENTYGIHVDQIDGVYCLRPDRSSKSFLQVLDKLIEWNDAREKGLTDFESSVAYEEWKLHYPPYINLHKE